MLVSLSATVRYLVLLDMSSNVEGCLLISVATSLKCIALKIPSRRFSLLSLSSSHSISLISLIVLVVELVLVSAFDVVYSSSCSSLASLKVTRLGLWDSCVPYCTWILKNRSCQLLVGLFLEVGETWWNLATDIPKSASSFPGNEVGIFIPS